MLLALILCALRTARSSLTIKPAPNPFSSVEAGSPLASLDPVKVGFTRSVNLDHGRIAKVRTLAVDPPLFYIEGFLSSEESQALVDEAHARVNEGSLMGGSTPKEVSNDVQRQQKGRSFLQFRKMFKHFDKDKNGALDKTELGRLLHNVYQLPNHDQELFMQRYNISSPLPWMGGQIHEYQLHGINLAEYREWIIKNHPYMMERHSQQVWLSSEKENTKPLIDRASKITGLPKAVVSGERSVQVLHYGKLGHYSCHYDSPPSHIPGGKVVRLGTMAVFLNEPEAGGQIAFPGADKIGTDKWNVTHWTSMKYECQATQSCTAMGGIVVPPRTGDAVLWYNMKPNHWRANSTGAFEYHWSGKTDDTFNWNSLHCGAEVLKGEKWIANMWFRARPNNLNQQVQTTIDAPSTITV